MEVNFYRVNDPLENFKIKVSIRELKKVVENEQKRGAFQCERTISWQEKIDGPKEIVARIMKQDPQAPVNSLEGTMLFTRIDSDHFHPPHPNTLYDSNGRESYVSVAVNNPAFGGDPADLPPVALEARSKLVEARVNRERRYKTFHICLATDVNVDVLKTAPWDPAHYYVENVLCSIRVYEDNLLEVSPGLSRPISERASEKIRPPEMSKNVAGTVGKSTVSAGAAVTPSVFLDDDTIVNSVRKGFKLSTFRLISRAGVEYEYTLHNVFDVYSPQQLEEIRKKQAFQDAELAQQSRQLNSGWKQDPPAQGYAKSVAMFAEIVSATGFEGSRLYITYEVLAPQEWSLRTGNLVDGLAEKDVAAMGAVFSLGGGSKSYSGAELLALDDFPDGVEAEGALRGSTHTATAFTRRGGVNLPLLRPHWRGMHLPWSLDRYSRVVLGLSFFVISCLSVILGVEYPFWLVPAMVVLFTVGTGLPGGPVQVVLQKTNKTNTLKTKDIQNNNQAALPRRQHQRNQHPNLLNRQQFEGNVKQMSSSLPCSGGPASAKKLVGSELIPETWMFGHLFNMSFDVKETSEETKQMAPSAESATIIFQVYSLCPFGRSSLEGYGFQLLPNQAGAVDVEISTWKPVGSVTSQLQDFFLGMSTRLDKTSFAELSDKTSTVLHRSKFMSESSGTIRFRCNSIVTDPRLTISPDEVGGFNSARSRGSGAGGRGGGSGSAGASGQQHQQMRRTVEDILQQFKSSLGPGGIPRNSGTFDTLRGSAAAGVGASMESSGRKSLSRQPSLNSISSPAAASRVSMTLHDVLARARSKTSKLGRGVTSVPEGREELSPTELPSNSSLRVKKSSRRNSGSGSEAETEMVPGRTFGGPEAALGPLSAIGSGGNAGASSQLNDLGIAGGAGRPKSGPSRKGRSYNTADLDDDDVKPADSGSDFGELLGRGRGQAAQDILVSSSTPLDLADDKRTSKKSAPLKGAKGVGGSDLTPVEVNASAASTASDSRKLRAGPLAETGALDPMRPRGERPLGGLAPIRPAGAPSGGGRKRDGIGSIEETLPKFGNSTLDSELDLTESLMGRDIGAQNPTGNRPSRDRYNRKSNLEDDELERLIEGE